MTEEVNYILISVKIAFRLTGDKMLKKTSVASVGAKAEDPQHRLGLRKNKTERERNIQRERRQSEGELITGRAEHFPRNAHTEESEVNADMRTTIEFPQRSS